MAQEVARRSGATMVVSEVVLPELSGPAVVRRLIELGLDAPVVFPRRAVPAGFPAGPASPG